MSDKKIMIIFPGMGYHSDKPLLYFTKRIGREKNYEIAEVSYEFPYKAREIMNDRARMKEAFEDAASQIKEQLSDIRFEDYGDIVFVGKSIGTALAAYFDAQLNVGARHIVFTPVPQTFDMSKKNAGIVFHGLNDPWCKTEIADEKAKELELEMYKVDNANHSLETGSAMADLKSLQGIMEKVEKFIDINNRSL